jgi:hypothetical protein
MERRRLEKLTGEMEPPSGIVVASVLWAGLKQSHQNKPSVVSAWVFIYAYFHGAFWRYDAGNSITTSRAHCHVAMCAAALKFLHWSADKLITD